MELKLKDKHNVLTRMDEALPTKLNFDDFWRLETTGLRGTQQDTEKFSVTFMTIQ